MPGPYIAELLAEHDDLSLLPSTEVPPPAQPSLAEPSSPPARPQHLLEVLAGGAGVAGGPADSHVSSPFGADGRLLTVAGPPSPPPSQGSYLEPSSMPALGHEPSLLAPSSSSGAGAPPPLFEEGVSALHGPAKRFLQPMSLGLGGQVPKRGRHIAEILQATRLSALGAPPLPTPTTRRTRAAPTTRSSRPSSARSPMAWELSTA